MDHPQLASYEATLLLRNDPTRNVRSTQQIIGSITARVSALYCDCLRMSKWPGVRHQGRPDGALAGQVFRPRAAALHPSLNERAAAPAPRRLYRRPATW